MYNKNKYAMRIGPNLISKIFFINKLKFYE